MSIPMYEFRGRAAWQIIVKRERKIENSEKIVHSPFLGACVSVQLKKNILIFFLYTNYFGSKTIMRGRKVTLHPSFLFKIKKSGLCVKFDIFSENFAFFFQILKKISNLIYKVKFHQKCQNWSEILSFIKKTSKFGNRMSDFTNKNVIFFSQKIKFAKKSQHLTKKVTLQQQVSKLIKNVQFCKEKVKICHPIFNFTKKSEILKNTFKFDKKISKFGNMILCNLQILKISIVNSSSQSHKNATSNFSPFILPKKWDNYKSKALIE